VGIGRKSTRHGGMGLVPCLLSLFEKDAAKLRKVESKTKELVPFFAETE
jgi:hypothetical protein